jgi:hypothetical protein
VIDKPKEPILDSGGKSKVAEINVIVLICPSLEQ